MRTPYLLCVLAIFLAVTSCTKHKPAPVKNISQKSYNSSHSLSKQHKFKRKYMTVKKGDTLYSIGFSNHIDFKKLAKINNIKAPYRIYPGQKLRLVANKVRFVNKNNSRRNSKGNSKKAIKTTSVQINKYNPKANSAKKSSTTKSIVKNPPVIKKPTNTVVSKKPVIQKPVNKTPGSNSKWIWPVKGKVISSFSASDMSRKGIDISVSMGHSVLASNNGTVVYSGDGLRGYGELIIIKHSNNLLSAYAHNSKRLVKEGQDVKQGQKIALSGKGTDGKHLLHFEIRKNGQPVNPIKYLPTK